MDMKNRISNATPPVSSTNVPDTSQRPGTLDLEFGEYQDGMVIFSEAGPGFVGTYKKRDGICLSAFMTRRPTA